MMHAHSGWRWREEGQEDAHGVMTSLFLGALMSAACEWLGAEGIRHGHHTTSHLLPQTHSNFLTRHETGRMVERWILRFSNWLRCAGRNMQVKANETGHSRTST